MYNIRSLRWFLVVVILAAAAFTAPVASAQEPVTEEVEFITHIAAGLAEQHVFVESADDANMVVRLKGEAAADPVNLAKPVYASALTEATDFLELGPNPFGPFYKGEPLGFTLEEWLAATGSGTYTVTGDMAELDFAFQNLVPNGVYTMWCSRLTLAPAFKEALYPCGAVDGSENTFIADEEGNGAFTLTMPAMPASNMDVISDIAVAYHSDGQTYGTDPGDFGRITHVQLFIAAPPPAPLTPQIEAKIESAMSAAPPAIAAEATIMDYPAEGETDLVELRPGTNDWTCFPDWLATPGNDPMCLDPMWMAWFEAISTGAKPNITAPGLSYMLAGGSDASNTDPFATGPAPGEDWIASPPHVMLLFPDQLDPTHFSTDHQSGGPYIMWSGTPYEHIMMPVHVEAGM